MAYLFPGALVPALDNNGNPLAGAKMHIYLAETVTPTSSWTSDEGSTPNSNPVLADAGGRWPPVYLDPDVPVRVLTTSASGDYIIYDVDHVAPGLPDTAALLSMLASTGGAALIGTSTGETVEDRLARNSYGMGLFTDLAATPPVIDVAETMVWTTGHTEEGIGIARYIHDSDVDLAYVTAHPLSSFLADDGRGFRIDTQQDLHIEMFGGRCDTPISEFTYNFTNSRAITPGTDNLPAIEEAMLVGIGYEYYAAYGHAQPIYFQGYGDGMAYYCSGTIVPPYKVNFRGFSSGHSRGDGSTILFPANTTGIIIYLDSATPAGGTSGHRSSFDGIHFLGSGGTTRTAHGVKLRGPVNMRNCVVEAFAGNLIDNQAATNVATSADNFGLTSGSYIERVYLRYAGNWACFTEGADTSASTFVMVDIQHARLGGCWDNSAFGNTYVGLALHSFGNGLVGQVSHGGRNYSLISPTAGVGASTTPGTNNLVWYDTGAGASYPAWSGAATYEMSSPVGGNPAAYSSASVFVGTYIEGSVPASPSPGSVVIGGTGGTTRYTKRMLAGSTTAALNCPTGFGSYKQYSPAHSTLGDWFRSEIGAEDGEILVHGRGTDGTLWKLQHSGADIYYGYGGQGTGNQVISKLSGPNTTETFGSSAAQPHWMGFYGVAVGSRNGMTTAVRVVAGDAAPTTGAWRKGDRVLNNNAAAGGFSGWICTTAGTPGTWKTFGAISA